MEELKLILDAVAQLGVEGKSAFVWYLVMTEGLSTVGLAAFLGTVVVSLKLIIKANESANAHHRAVQDIYKLVMNYPRTELDRHDLEDLVRRVATLKK